jgi:hypothetical protein
MQSQGRSPGISCLFGSITTSGEQDPDSKGWFESPDTTCICISVTDDGAGSDEKLGKPQPSHHPYNKMQS